MLGQQLGLEPDGVTRYHSDPMPLDLWHHHQRNTPAQAATYTTSPTGEKQPLCASHWNPFIRILTLTNLPLQLLFCMIGSSTIAANVLKYERAQNDRTVIIMCSDYLFYPGRCLNKMDKRKLIPLTLVNVKGMKIIFYWQKVSNLTLYPLSSCYWKQAR